MKKWILSAALAFLIINSEISLANDGYRRLNNVDVLHYKIRLEIGHASSEIRGETTIRVKTTNPIDILPLDLVSLRVDTVRVNGQETNFEYIDGKLNVLIDQDHVGQEIINIAVTYHGKPSDGLFLQKNKFGERSVFADNWPNRARNWFPSIDHPYDKATVEFIITAPSDFDVVANGRLVEITPVSAKLKQTHWKPDVAIPTYCMVIGAARFSIISAGMSDNIPVSYYLFPPDSARGSTDFSRSIDMLSFYTNLFGPYPYEKLSLVQSSTRFGGMENASAIFLDENSITGTKQNETVIAHEIVHQWFGDSVTESDWLHLWLSEGFATYFGAVFYEKFDGIEQLNVMLQQHRSRYFKANDRLSIPIVNPTTTNLFDLLNAYNYSKGALVLHMLRNLLGDQDFFDGIRRYYQLYRDKTALTHDFQVTMELQSEMKLAWFFDQWIFRSGHPELDVTWSWSEQSQEVVVVVKQTQSQAPFRFPLTLAFINQETEIRSHVDIRERLQIFRFKKTLTPEILIIDPEKTLLIRSRVKLVDH